MSTFPIVDGEASALLMLEFALRVDAVYMLLMYDFCPENELRIYADPPLGSKVALAFLYPQFTILNNL
jgi:hypothetical protein